MLSIAPRHRENLNTLTFFTFLGTLLGNENVTIEEMKTHVKSVLGVPFRAYPSHNDTNSKVYQLQRVNL